MYEVPTIEAIRDFADKINSVRVEYGLSPVQVWDVTGSTPGNGMACLSARHLVGPVSQMRDEIVECDGKAHVGSRTLRVSRPYSTDNARFADALMSTMHGGDVVIPHEIANVTDVFDSYYTSEDDEYSPVTTKATTVAEAAAAKRAMRDRFIEAGYEAD